MDGFKIKEDGTIVRDGNNISSQNNSPDHSLYNEYNKLVYEINHPERFSEEEIESKKARMHEIETSGVKLNDDKALKLKIAELKTQAKMSGENNILMSEIARYKKQND